MTVEEKAKLKQPDNSEQEKKWRFCVAGNIVKSHLDETGTIRYGSKAFVGGTKVYLDGKYWPENSPDIYVIGQNRFGKYAYERIAVELIENVRFQRVFKRIVLSIMDSQEWLDGIHWWGRTVADRKDAQRFASEWPVISKPMEENRKGSTENDDCSRGVY